MVEVAGATLGVIGLVVLVGALWARLLRPRPATAGAPERPARASTTAALATLFVLPPWALLSGIGSTLPTATFPLVISLAVTATTALATRLWPRPSGPIRTAALAPRRVGIATIPRLRRLLVASTVALFALLVAGAATADPSGHSVTRTVAGQAGTDGGYPGWLYAIPLALLAIATLVATGWALREVEAQPAMSDPARDAAYRVRTTARALRAALFGIAATAAGVAFALGSSLNQATQQMRARAGEAGVADALRQPPWDWVQNTGFVVIGLGVVMLLVVLYAVGAVPTNREVEADLRRIEERPA